MKSKRTHFWLVVLLVIDVCLVIASIALEIEFLSSEKHDLEHFCSESLCPLTSEQAHHLGHTELEEARTILSGFSIAILSIFLLDFLAQMVAVGVVTFFSDWVDVMDLCVVIASIALEITMENSPEGGLLILARAWRFIRIGHGLYESVHEHDKKHLERLMRLRKYLEPFREPIERVYSSTPRDGGLSEHELLQRIVEALEESHVLKHIEHPAA